MKNLYFDTYHTDLVGGGGLALYNLSVALQDLYEVHLAAPWDEGMHRYEFLRAPSRPFKIGRPPKVDVLVASKYSDFVPPSADINVFYCLYPRYPWNMSGYDKIFTLSRYCQDAVKVRWGKESRILVGGAFYPDYGPGLKENIFLCSSRFFMEGDVGKLDGHSKNQHILIDAFRYLPHDLDWKLVLSGSVILESDQRYFEACRRLAGGDPGIEFYPMATREELRDLYGKSKVFLHAMGYARRDPAETEHYGICVEKARLSGCTSIVHESGGAPELSDFVWWDRTQLTNLMLQAATSKLGQLPKLRRTWDDFKLEVMEAFTF